MLLGDGAARRRGDRSVEADRVAVLEQVVGGFELLRDLDGANARQFRTDGLAERAFGDRTNALEAHAGRLRVRFVGCQRSGGAHDRGVRRASFTIARQASPMVISR